jgi:LacI family fructose operon transcriptional repressor
MAKTVEQIANDLNLSVTTVRLVLGNKAAQYRISAKTQTRVMEYVGHHGYTLNHSARSLKLNKTYTLGLILPCLSNVFFATLAEKLELYCRKFGYQLMISCTYDDPDYENKLVEALIARNTDGLFIVPSSRENQQHHLKRVKKPLVFLDRDFLGMDHSLIESNNIDGGDTLAQAMLQAGAAPLWFLAGDPELPSIRQRLAGYRRALAAQGLDPAAWVATGRGNSAESGSAMMAQIINAHGLPAAFIASSLPVLEGAIEAVRAHAGALPAAISLGTFDEHPMLGFLANNVWSMQQNEDAWAQQAFEMMQQRMDGAPPQGALNVDMTLITRHH